MNSPVQVRREPVKLPTYEPMPADKNPMFLEKRVYQGSSGKVYPLPFYDRIAEEKTDRTWDAVWIENDFIRVMMEAWNSTGRSIIARQPSCPWMWRSKSTTMAV